MACIVAALVHDFEHLGLNNDYLVKVFHERALAHNDRAPNENHHVSVAAAATATTPVPAPAPALLLLLLAIIIKRIIILVLVLLQVVAAFRVMSRPECNFCHALSRPQKSLMRKIMIDMVLATDMAEHQRIVSLLRQVPLRLLVLRY